MSYMKNWRLISFQLCSRWCMQCSDAGPDLGGSLEAYTVDPCASLEVALLADSHLASALSLRVVRT